MKILSLAIVLCVLAFSACGQGKVLFANDSTRQLVFNPTYMLEADMALAGQPVTASPLPSGITLFTALCAGTPGSSLSRQNQLFFDGCKYKWTGALGAEVHYFGWHSGWCESMF